MRLNIALTLREIFKSWNIYYHIMGHTFKEGHIELI